MSKYIIASFIFSLCACGPLVDDAERREATPIDRFRELEIVDDSVINSANAHNENFGAWSFAKVMRDVQAAHPFATCEAFATAWREAAVNADNLTCAQDASFRLIAISNRIDLMRHPDSPTGEARLVYALTDGNADHGSAALPATVIFEFALSADVSPEAWANRWHSLGALHGDAYTSALDALVRDFARPTQLSQVRVLRITEGRGAFAEVAIVGGTWHARGLRNSPAFSESGSELLSRYVKANEEAIASDVHVIPLEMRSKELALDDARWEVPNVDESVRHAFAMGTCNGCHGKEASTLDGGFHVSPLRQGPQRLSAFLNDPKNVTGDDLFRREEALRALLVKE